LRVAEFAHLPWPNEKKRVLFCSTFWWYDVGVRWVQILSRGYTIFFCLFFLVFFCSFCTHRFLDLCPSKNKAVHPKAEIEMILPETAFFVCFSKGIPWDAQSHRAPKFFFDFFFVFALVNWAVKLENFRLNLRMNS